MEWALTCLSLKYYEGIFFNNKLQPYALCLGAHIHREVDKYVPFTGRLTCSDVRIKRKSFYSQNSIKLNRQSQRMCGANFIDRCRYSFRPFNKILTHTSVGVAQICK